MFCKNCGEPVEEGNLFCKNCGARIVPEESATEVTPVSEVEVTAIRPPSEAEVTVVRPPSVPPPVPVTPAAAPPAPGPPTVPLPAPVSAGTASPPPPSPVASGYGPGWQPPVPPTGRESRTGLIVGIVAAAIIVLAGAGLGVYFGLIRDGDDAGSTAASETTEAAETTATTSADSSTSSSMAGTTESSAAVTTATTAAGTVQTVPGLGSSTTGTATPTSRSTTSTTEDPHMLYLDNAFELVNDLEACDRRIPDLATEINNTLPDVPDWVYEELQGMIDTILEDDEPMLYLEIPPAFRQANNHLDAAVTSMINRITYTMSGIEALWDTGNKTAGNSYFESGRVERDRYRSHMEKFHELLPVS